MDISKKDATKMRQLAQEGKQISKIQRENFSQYTYEQIYAVIYEAGGRAAGGMKKMITIRLNKLLHSNKETRASLINEIQRLVTDLFENHKKNQKKLDKIRKALQE
jgi:flagellin-specific chaperone FliS